MNVTVVGTFKNNDLIAIHTFIESGTVWMEMNANI